jgi:hypothetical protein
MTLDEFETLLDIHGTAFDNWPHDKRSPARHLLSTDQFAKAAWAGARITSDGLSQSTLSIAPPPVLAKKVMKKNK